MHHNSIDKVINIPLNAVTEFHFSCAPDPTGELPRRLLGADELKGKQAFNPLASLKLGSPSY
jgi:hypothetical protein